MSKLVEYLNNMNENGWINYSDYSNLVDMAQELEAENEQLRAMLDNAVELPTMGEFKIVDLHTNFYQIAYAVLYKSNGKLYIYQCFDKAKAEAKLKEQGGNV